ncbi:MAG: indole acetimide hydrolase [Gammaproteobacteria bacterium]|nr:MAG: indole acetimide hydrolase [Gammaproteobacteria bacterium]
MGKVDGALWQRTASELAALIRSGEVSSREVVEAHLERIEAVNGRVNAVTRVLAESARAAADAADASEAKGPLHGVPFTIKENIDFEGTPTTQGVPALADAISPVDAPVVERMKRAGAIALGRTNLPEFGLRISTTNPLHGRTLNPWDADRVAGGSSGGEGAALATGMTPIGLGNDIGGSLRNPAYCNGIASLKPSTGRIPHYMALPPQDGGMAVQAMLVEGPMARSVADLRLALTILAGRDIRDPVSVDAPLTGAAVPQRAVLVTELPGGPIESSSAAAVREAGAALAAAGWDVIEASPPELERVQEIWGRTLAHDLIVNMPLMELVISPELAVGLKQLFERFDPNAMRAAEVDAERSRLARLWSMFFVEHPVVIGPTWTRLPFAHDADLHPETGMALLTDTLRFITPGNLLGIPAVCVPCGVEGGLPRGVQIYADRWREDVALAAAEIVEAAMPPVCPIDPR